MLKTYLAAGVLVAMPAAELMLENGQQHTRSEEGTAMSNTLNVPGGHLYYEVRGSGPFLLLISGTPADADVYAALAGVLSQTYTVVTYDARGYSRSPVDGGPEDWQADVHGDDAARLVDALAKAPAYVFGNSAGALVGLNLAARHPQKVRTVVAHEPPAVDLLPDAAEHRARAQDVHDTYRNQGIGAAMQKFLAFAGLKGGPPADAGAPGAEAAEKMARMGRNMDLFLAHGLRQIGAYVPDVSTLRVGSPRIVVAGGDASTGQTAYRAAVVLAERLGTTIVHFPGDHGGFTTHPQAFAARLDAVLAGR